MNIYLRDTGFVRPDFTSGETSFDGVSSVGLEKKRVGEFKVEDRMLLKVHNYDISTGKVRQNIAGITDLRNKGNTISMNPIILNLSCSLEIQKNYNSGDALDVPKVKDLFLMLMSRGHKDLYLEDHPGRNVKDLFGLQVFLSTFGREDDPDGDGLFKRLNVDITDLRVINTLESFDFELECQVLWDF